MKDSPRSKSPKSEPEPKGDLAATEAKTVGKAGRAKKGGSGDDVGARASVPKAGARWPSARELASVERRRYWGHFFKQAERGFYTLLLLGLVGIVIYVALGNFATTSTAASWDTEPGVLSLEPAIGGPDDFLPPVPAPLDDSLPELSRPSAAGILDDGTTVKLGLGPGDDSEADEEEKTPKEAVSEETPAAQEEALSAVDPEPAEKTDTGSPQPEPASAPLEGTSSEATIEPNPAKPKRFGVLRLRGDLSSDVATVYREAALVWGLE